MNDDTARIRAGLAYGITAYGLWGLMPLYFNAMKSVPPFEILADRIIGSLVCLALLLTVTRRWSVIYTALAAPATRRLILLSTVLIGINWYLFVYAIVTQQVLQTSVGYFITPLISAWFGRLLFGEQLRLAQGMAIACATVGVAVMASAAGGIPALALGLAFSFGLYGVVRKAMPVDGITGLTLESALLTPPAVAYLAYQAAHGSMWFPGPEPVANAFVLLSGLVSSVPLVCFAASAQRLPLTMLGFVQYLSPSLAFILALTVLGETIVPVKVLAFACIWAGVAIFAFDAVRSRRKPQPALPDEAVPVRASA
jgi:chloramphenicol-sensitive protein RarD